MLINELLAALALKQHDKIVKALDNAAQLEPVD